MIAFVRTLIQFSTYRHIGLARPSSPDLPRLLSFTGITYQVHLTQRIAELPLTMLGIRLSTSLLLLRMPTEGPARLID